MAKTTGGTVGIYLRVSTDDQRHDSQRGAIEEWLRSSGLDPEAVAWYIDTETGTTMARQELDRLKGDVFRGTVRTVVVYKVDRLARRLRDGLNLLCDWTERGVRFISVTQHVDISGALGRMVAALLLGVAEIEWEYRRERQADGIRKAKAREVYTGRKPGTTKVRPDRARELRDRGLSAPEVAQVLGVSVRTVFRYWGIR